ncbi:MAG: SMC-Scp complex subunit ScpB [Candidatus Eisenbacteria bacterium]|nr:SMC-Scp complex subunit ScpB [Candidatus Eisenbacteria bacterium]
MRELSAIVEALLFCSGDAPLTMEQIADVVPEASPEEIEATLDALRQRYDAAGGGIGLFRVGGGHQLLTRPAVGEWVEKFLVGRRRQRLSRAALETLAIVAYRQPVTRGEIEAIRGVDCGGVLHTLLDRRLLAVRGRAKRVGSPLLYVTTGRFLEHFGIEELRELPKLEEFRALSDRASAEAELREQGVLAPADRAPGEPQQSRESDSSPARDASAEAQRPAGRDAPAEAERPAGCDASDEGQVSVRGQGSESDDDSSVFPAAGDEADAGAMARQIPVALATSAGSEDDDC